MENDLEIEEILSHKNDFQKIEEIINDLEEQKFNLINKQNYLEADKIQVSIEKLQKKKEFKDRKELEILHYNELKNLEQNFISEIDNLNEEYNKKITEIENQSKLWEDEIDSRHKEEVLELSKQISDQMISKFKNNKEYLNLIKQEELLVKSLKYIINFNRLKEAHVIKIKREKIQKKNEEECKKLEKIKTSSNNRLQFDKLEKKHKQEKDLLKAKIERELEKIKKEKLLTIDQLHQKFKNKKLILENVYKREINLSVNPVRAS